MKSSTESALKKEIKYYKREAVFHCFFFVYKEQMSDYSLKIIRRIAQKTFMILELLSIV